MSGQDTRQANASQSRDMFLAEAMANVVVGDGVAVLVQLLVLALFELHASLGDNMAIDTETPHHHALSIYGGVDGTELLSASVV